HCCLCGTFTGPFSEIEGLVTVLICIPCLEVRLVHPGTLPGPPHPPRPPGQPPRPRPALGAVGLPDRRLRPVVHRPLVPGGPHRGRASRLDGDLRAAAAVSEPAPAGRVP